MKDLVDLFESGEMAEPEEDNFQARIRPVYHSSAVFPPLPSSKDRRDIPLELLRARMGPGIISVPLPEP